VGLDRNAALIVIDVQSAFDHPRLWGPRNNPGAERVIATLCGAWEDTGRPIIMVRHSAKTMASPFARWASGHALKREVADVRASLLVEKSVNSAFLGTPDLDAWLKERGIRQIVMCGIQTNMCVETTARMGGNLGYKVLVAADATYTFDLKAPSGRIITADQLAEVTFANLVGGKFAAVAESKEILGNRAVSSDNRLGSAHG
jgi:nicotinamidase-related amidase